MFSMRARVRTCDYFIEFATRIQPVLQFFENLCDFLILNRALAVH